MTMTISPTHITITDALKNKALFGPFYFGASWNRWKSVFKGAFAEPLTTTELELFREVAGRDPPSRRVKTLACIVGRGGGKDATASFAAAYAAMSFDPKAARLRPGELAYVLCLAVDKGQASIVFGYIRALFEKIPALKAMARNIGSDSIELSNSVVIQVTTNSFRSIRGRSILCAIFDEVSFWRDDSAAYASPDSEVAGAVRPGMARVPNSMLIMISSAHRRSGILYDKWKTSYGKDDPDCLVVRGTTLQFNPLFDQAIIDADLAEDPARYEAEYNSEWRDDLSSFVDRLQLERCVHRGMLGRSPQDGVSYFAFTDTSSGRNDSFTACIAHREIHNGVMRVVIDYIYVKQVQADKFDPSVACAEVAALLKIYRITEITGDRYAIGFVDGHFKKLGINYIESKLNKSEIFLNFLPMIMSAQVLLLDHPKGLAEIAALERRTTPADRDKVSKPKGGHDDIANSIAGVAVLAALNFEQPIYIGPPILVHKDGTSSLDSMPGAVAPDSTAEWYRWQGNGGGSGFSAGAWGSIGTREFP
jgi:hypothetical protein